MVDDVLIGEADRLQRNRLPLGIDAERLGVRPGIALEHIVERAIFLKDDDDVRDRVRRAAAAHTRGESSRRGVRQQSRSGDRCVMLSAVASSKQ